MPITLSNATIDDINRKKFNNSSIDASSFASNVDYNDGEKLAGITADFAQAVSATIDTYISEIKQKIDAIENLSSTTAFQGQGVTESIKKFVQGVKDSANAYITALQSAERQIVESVEEVYKFQDTRLESDLKSDAISLSSETPDISMPTSVS